MVILVRRSLSAISRKTKTAMAYTLKFIFLSFIKTCGSRQTRTGVATPRSPRTHMPTLLLLYHHDMWLPSRCHLIVQHGFWCFCQLFLILESKKEKEWEEKRGITLSRAFLEILPCNFSFHLIGQNAVTWEFLTSEETRNVVFRPCTLLPWWSLVWMVNGK